VDDLVLVVMGLNMLLNEVDQKVLEDNWSGELRRMSMPIGRTKGKRSLDLIITSANNLAALRWF